MKGMTHRWRTVLLAAPVVGALAFGGTQALASPTESSPSAGRCLPDARCDSLCPNGGFVVSSTGVCRCCPTSPIVPGQ
ncbi:hypothetical protein [Longimicrobium sp.]|uniref:hypothetical protein n=1 Tax=Longimicrobium sp. TaxID=2029185 RepID=UPI003B3B2321